MLEGRPKELDARPARPPAKCLTEVSGQRRSLPGVWQLEFKPREEPDEGGKRASEHTSATPLHLHFWRAASARVSLRSGRRLRMLNTMIGKRPIIVPCAIHNEKARSRLCACAWRSLRCRSSATQQPQSEEDSQFRGGAKQLSRCGPLWSPPESHGLRPSIGRRLRGGCWPRDPPLPLDGPPPEIRQGSSSQAK